MSPSPEEAAEPHDLLSARDRQLAEHMAARLAAELRRQRDEHIFSGWSVSDWRLWWITFTGTVAAAVATVVAVATALYLDRAVGRHPQQAVWIYLVACALFIFIGAGSTIVRRIARRHTSLRWLSELGYQVLGIYVTLIVAILLLGLLGVADHVR